MEKKEKDILIELRECYDKGLVSALVGAGFSKNVSNLFLSWGELLHDMIGELYEIDIKRNYDNYLHQSFGVIPDPKSKETLQKEYISEICKHEDYLELVSKYIQKKGIRESLEIYIENRIPYVTFNADGKIVLKIGNQEKEQISDVKFSAHKELLLLNKLQNIYTTNYENLIEFTIDLLGLGIKDAPKIVRSGRDLSDNIRNRNVIKIHGNLREESRGKIYFDGDNKLQYIIAKEDYDTYKEKHEAFSSLMRIAMLQGKFMLLGFSGTDANYKGWVTWMSDVLEGESDDVTKIYIIDISGKETPLDLQLYYDNHHTKVINLINEERLSIIGFEKHDIIAILQRQKDNKLDNDTKRDILTKFFAFLRTGVLENEEFISGDSSADPDKVKEGEVKSVDTQNVLTLKNAISDSYDYKKLWQEASSKINDDIINDIAARIRDAKPQNRFPKVIYNQDYIIDNIVRKSTLNGADAYLLALAIDECGLNPHYYSRLIKDYDELNKLPLWNLLKLKEETLNGKDTKLTGTDDEIIYENVQRSLFHLDFKKANNTIKRWKPKDYFIVLKAMRLAAQNDKCDKAFKLLSDYIEKEDNLSTKLYAMQIANYISNRYPWPYDTEILYQYGVDGIGDMLNFMIQQLRGKVEAPKPRGWIGSTMNLGGSHPKYEKSLRILRYISDCGLYVNFGFTYFFDKANWYLVFQNLYEEFPYPCFFYSIQYNDEGLLTRIGQDFAYSPKLCDFNQDILLRSIKAYGDCNTPKIFLKGLLSIIGPMYLAVDETIWFEAFNNNIFKKLIDNFNKYNRSDLLIKNIKYALVSLRCTNNIKYVLEILLNHYCDNCELVDSFIQYDLHIKCLRGEELDSVWRTIKGLISQFPTVDISGLVFFMEENEIITKELEDLFMDNFINANEKELPQSRSSSLYLCLLAKNNPDAMKKAKELLLRHDIWHCGVLDDGRGWSSPNYYRLNKLKDILEWTDDEFEYISNNLRENINKYNQRHQILHEESFMRNVQVEYLSDVLRFIDGLSNKRKDSLRDIRETVEELLKERISYTNLIEGMLSEQSGDADCAMDDVIQGIVVQGLNKYIDEFNFILDRAIFGNGQIINAIVHKIRIVVQNCPDEIKSERLCSKLHTILAIYKGKWNTFQEFKPAWSFNHLYVIAEFLKENGFEDSDAIKYWLTDSYIMKFIRL